MRAVALLAVVFAACGDSGQPCDPDAPNTICTIAGKSVEAGNSGDGGPATQAVMYVPMDTAISPQGEVWVIDFNNYTVRAIDAKGIIRTVVGNGELGDSPTQDNLRSVPAVDAYFNHTTNLFFADGYLYLAAWHNSRVKRVSLSDMMIENFAGRGRRMYYDGDGGPALMASLDLPSSVARDPQGNIVVMDQANQVIRQIDKDNIVHTIVGQCIVEETSACSGATPVACPGSNKLVCGDTAQCADACTPAFSGDGGPATLARIAQPYGQVADPAGRMVYDQTGNLYFADTDNSRIRKVDTHGIITTIAGTGTPAYSGDGGPATAANINRPVDVAAAPDGTIYFTDVYNNCVRKIDPTGTINTVVGQCSSKAADRGFAGDGGPPLDARLDRPYGIDLVGNKLYVSDSYNNRVRVVNLP